MIFAAISSLAIGYWQARRKRAKVTLFVENRFESRYVWNLYGPNPPLPSHDYLILRVAVPNDGPGIVIRKCRLEIWSDGQNGATTEAHSRARLPRRLDRGDWHEETITVDELKQFAISLGISRGFRVKAIVEDSVGNLYTSKDYEFRD